MFESDKKNKRVTKRPKHSVKKVEKSTNKITIPVTKLKPKPQLKVRKASILKEEPKYETPLLLRKTTSKAQETPVSVEEEVKRVLALDEEYPTQQSSHGCIKCNCKKSRCLKLYCDCFAAGLPC